MSSPGARSVGAYTIERELGSGGMGQVLLGRQVSLDRPAVLKKLRRDLAAIPEGVERFQREARAAAALHHPNVVSVYDCFSFRGDPYIAQEYVDGLDLSSVLGKTLRLPARITGLIALEIARGLEAIHARGTVHRDLKPANVLVSRRGEVKIADFGIALDPTGPALTRTGIVLGTPSYMSPEHLQGERLDARADLFALGVVIYEMLTGARPFEPPTEGAPEGESLLARMRREDYEPLRRREPSVPRWLARLVRQLLRPRARQRIPSAAALRRELERQLRPPSAPELHAELAEWLWERGVFELREGETLIQIGSTQSAARRVAWPVAIAASLVMAGVLWIRATPELQLSPWAKQAIAWGTALVDVPSARLSFEAGADVWVRIDGAPPQPAERFSVRLAPGRHQLIVGGPGVEPRVHELELVAGELRVLSAADLLRP
jgi:serine/threonine protein kinase